MSEINLPDIVRKTLQHTEARIFSGFGWGLTKKIENHGLSRFKANLQRVRFYFTTASSSLTCNQSREGVSLILGLLRQSRLQPMALGGGSESPMVYLQNPQERDSEASSSPQSPVGVWRKLKSWFYPRP